MPAIGLSLVGLLWNETLYICTSLFPLYPLSHILRNKRYGCVEIYVSGKLIANGLQQDSMPKKKYCIEVDHCDRKIVIVNCPFFSTSKWHVRDTCLLLLFLWGIGLFCFVFLLFFFLNLQFIQVSRWLEWVVYCKATAGESMALNPVFFLYNNTPLISRWTSWFLWNHKKLKWSKEANCVERVLRKLFICTDVSFLERFRN